MRIARLTSFAGACALALATSSSAFASDQTPTTQRIFPEASALCATAGSGAALPARVTVTPAAVAAACTTLQNAFAQQLAALGAAQTTLRQTMSTQQSAMVAACPVPITDAAACHAARETRTKTDEAAILTYRAAIATFHAAIVTDRTAFWTAVTGTSAGIDKGTRPAPLRPVDHARPGEHRK